MRGVTRSSPSRQAARWWPLGQLLGAALAALLLCSASLPARAQARDLFVPIPANERSAATAEQRQRVAQLRQLPTTKSLELVRIDTATLQDNSARLTMPDQKALVFSKQSVDAQGAANFIWHGTLSNVPGSATLVVHDGKITGTVRNGLDLYRIEPVGDGVHAVIAVDQSRFPPEDPTSFENIERQNQGNLRLLGPAAENPVDIDVAVGYTPSAADLVGDIVGMIHLAVAEANESYANSKINIKLSLVDSFLFSYTETDKDLRTILDNFAADAGVNQRRDATGADLSVLIINQSVFCGMADAIMAKPATAFAVVHYACATGNYSFAHELGHLMGARHDEEHDPNNSPFPYGHGLQYPPAWRTIMAFPCKLPDACNTRILYWSNPSVRYDGVPTGTVATNDNARVLNETAGTVAAFRNHVTPSSWGGWENLGGTIKEAPNCVSWGANRIDCFARGDDNAMHHRWWDGVAWRDWDNLGGTITGAPNCVSLGANRIDCFARSTDRAMWRRWWDGVAWRGWDNLGGPITGTPNCVSLGANRIDCFARGDDNAMHHRWWDGVAWRDWENLGGAITGAPSCVSWGANRIDCFARGDDNAMHHRWWDGVAWRDWDNLGGAITGAPNCVSSGADRIDCFARGTDQSMWHRWWDGAAWRGWDSLGAGAITEVPNCVSLGANRIDCFARSTGQAIYHRWGAGSSWGSWEDLGGIIMEAPNCVSSGANRIDCFARSTDRAMWHRWWPG
jgi:hypothetical protein